ncbi:hypothetical protein BSKO_14021 [Bryopsis sp. KO-2023]|nr:hypothetical protein BSKO_14021 [Bryopsis sp. KO-2023]
MRKQLLDEDEAKAEGIRFDLEGELLALEKRQRASLNSWNTIEDFKNVDDVVADLLNKGGVKNLVIKISVQLSTLSNTARPLDDGSRTVSMESATKFQQGRRASTSPEFRGPDAKYPQPPRPATSPFPLPKHSKTEANNHFERALIRKDTKIQNLQNELVASRIKLEHTETLRNASSKAAKRSAVEIAQMRQSLVQKEPDMETLKTRNKELEEVNRELEARAIYLKMRLESETRRSRALNTRYQKLRQSCSQSPFMGKEACIPLEQAEKELQFFLIDTKCLLQLLSEEGLPKARKAMMIAAKEETGKKLAQLQNTIMEKRARAFTSSKEQTIKRNNNRVKERNSPAAVRNSGSQGRPVPELKTSVPRVLKRSVSAVYRTKPCNAGPGNVSKAPSSDHKNPEWL